MSDDERVISWFEENYKGLIVGVIIGLSTLFLYKSYISNQNISQLELSREFDIAVQSYQEGNNAKILEFSELNMEKNPDNIYTSLANLYSAKLMYAEDKINSSYVFLNHIINHSKDEDIIDIAKYRKAKLLVEENKLDEAHNVLGNMPDNYQHNELKGDIFYLENNFEDAFNQYNIVLTFEITPNERKNILAKINLVK